MSGHKKVLVAFQPGMLEEIDERAAYEHRNRSDLIREAVRRYIATPLTVKNLRDERSDRNSYESR